MEKRGRLVLNFASKIVKQLKSYSKKIEIVGSIRRKSENPHDVDIVLIPKDIEKIKAFMSKKGKNIEAGKERTFWRVDGIDLDLFYTNEEEWGAALLAFSGKKGSNIGLRVIAKNKGFKLTQHGLFNRKTGKRVAGKTEHEIYSALNRPYKEPWDR
ncbi:MAG: hypothetical protein AABX48_00490 [Nanoarchaeota archaeon]